MSALRSHGDLCAIVETLPRLEAIRECLHCPVPPSSRCLGVLLRFMVPLKEIAEGCAEAPAKIFGR